MADDTTKPLGTIGWSDLTVPNATEVRDFYAAVCGWTFQAVAMDGYDDYAMLTADGETSVAGICHARGQNADIPPQWLNYVTVRDLDAALAACAARGGRIIRPATAMGSYGTLAVIADPAGAVLALLQPPQ
jgi:predicted enzyme related to lactoylglutathione lyase